MIEFVPAGHPVSSPRSPMASPASEKPLRQSYFRRGQLSGNVQTDVGERVSRFLRQTYPTRTVDQVAADLSPWGIGASAIAKWLERNSAPAAKAWVALICCYGPAFLAAALPNTPAWLDKATLDERIATLEANIEAQRRELERLR